MTVASPGWSTLKSWRQIWKLRNRNKVITRLANFVEGLCAFYLITRCIWPFSRETLGKCQQKVFISHWCGAVQFFTLSFDSPEVIFRKHVSNSNSKTWTWVLPTSPLHRTVNLYLPTFWNVGWHLLVWGKEPRVLDSRVGVKLNGDLDRNAIRIKEKRCEGWIMATAKWAAMVPKSQVAGTH